MVCLILAANDVNAQVSAQACGTLKNAFGPFDYRSSHHVPNPGDNQPHAEKLDLVERAHFTGVVEMGIRGTTSRLPGGDLDYTLRAIPNHHRALVTVIRLWEKSRLPTPPGFERIAECYFERALRFRPSDDIARMLYASFLIKGSRIPEAKEQLDNVADRTKENALTHYNLGMLYADASLFESAKLQAGHALSLGMERPDLVRRLEAAGHWQSRDGPAIDKTAPASK